MKLYCKENLSRSTKKVFLREYFNKYQPATYIVGTNKIQCHAGKNRSIGNIKALLDGTFKTPTSLEQTAKILVKLVLKNQACSLWCSYIGKVVFYGPKNPYYYYTFIWGSSHFKAGTDGFSWNKLKEIYES